MCSVADVTDITANTFSTTAGAYFHRRSVAARYWRPLSSSANGAKQGK